MNPIDILIVIAGGIGLFSGFKRGLIRIVMDVVAMAAAIYLAFSLQGEVIAFLSPIFPVPVWALKWLAFFGLWGAVFLCVLVVSQVVHTSLSVTIFGPLNRIGGALFGVLRNILFLLPVFMAMTYMNTQLLDSAKLYPHIEPAVTYLVEDVIPTQLTALGSELDKKLADPAKESVKDLSVPDTLIDQIDKEVKALGY